MQAIEAAVDQIDQMGGPPVRDARRLKPAQRPPQPSQIKHFQRFKRKAFDAAEVCVEPSLDEDEEELRYQGLQRLCSEALRCNRACETGEQAFLGHACTFVEAFGLCFDDCYDESSRLPTAPAFEQRVIIGMQVRLFLRTPTNMLDNRVVCKA